MTRYKRRVDRNQKEIVKGLTERYGDGSVVLLSTVGEGVPDLLFGYAGVNLLLEVKTDDGTLTPSQIDWHARWPGQKAVVRSTNEAITVIEQAIGRT